jgi:nucleotide-binding universal stress UspA family protein
MTHGKPAAIRDILTVVDLAGRRPATAHAIDLATQTGAHLTGLVPVFDYLTPSVVGGGIPASVLADIRASAEQPAREAMKAFDAMASAAGVAFEAARFDGGEGEFEELAARARLCDVAIVGQEDPERPEGDRRAVIETLLFSAGAPTLVVPYIASGQHRGAKIAVAWDGGRPAGRSVRGAMPFLAAAESVSVIVVDDGSRFVGEPGADLALFLARHGLPVTILRVPPVERDVAAAMLNVVSDEGFDMLVMGAYGHSRFRQFVLGGTTRDILETMTVPVLMAH